MERAVQEEMNYTNEELNELANSFKKKSGDCVKSVG